MSYEASLSQYIRALAMSRLLYLVLSAGRTHSSKRWLHPQLNAPYVAHEKREGFRSRAAYKLIEIDDRHGLLRVGASVIDLGAAPGGWSQVAAKRVGAVEGRGRVLAVDLLDMAPIAGVEFVHLDFLDA